MNKTKAKSASLARRQRRVRGKISGTAARPRLRITRSNTHMYAQLIDDVGAVTIAAVATNEADVTKKLKGSTSNKEAAKMAGELLAKRGKDAGVTEVVFDRGGRIYHGRVQALADGAREAGLKF
ncbi:MAG: 50S ribosomal protein L18 [Coriobacteriia bacterium]|nr:50S ribosomal protein L18 [Coriobacteriia bacterium]MCL2745812.1 50S ribosomal protein L18 [Coriobacteriia bacterium]MCL2870410.1 50S ribosomal protein L18 [Coriobacteriia bacterium]